MACTSAGNCNYTAEHSRVVEPSEDLPRLPISHVVDVRPPLDIVISSPVTGNNGEVTARDGLPCTTLYDQCQRLIADRSRPASLVSARLVLCT
jgi:hypothetical protein